MKKRNDATFEVASTRALKANFSVEVSLFVRDEAACIAFFEGEFPCQRPFYPTVFVSAQRQKLDRMNYHETWRIIRAWKPPLNEAKPCGGVTTISDNNNVSLWRRKTRVDRIGVDHFRLSSLYLSLCHSSPPSYLGERKIYISIFSLSVEIKLK